MRNWVLDLLSCPHCANDVSLDISSTKSAGDEILEGELSCPSCGREFLITKGIPRFVEGDENYAENFGYQWQIFRSIQIDRFSGHNLSGLRLINDTRWTPEFMEGKVILDAGCGTGSYAIGLSQKGFSVVGLDSAKDLLKQAERKLESLKNNQPNFVHGDLKTLPTDMQAHAVLCRGVLGNILEQTERHTILQHFARILRPTKGSLILDVRNWTTTKMLPAQECQRTFKTAQGELLFCQELKIAPGGTQKIRVSETHILNSAKQKVEETHSFELYCYQEKNVRQALEQVGFTSIEIFGNYDAESKAHSSDWLVAIASIVNSANAQSAG